MSLNLENLPLEIVSIVVWLLSFVITYVTIPRIIYIVKQKNLVDKPNGRSSHKESTPTLGGIAFYLSLVLSLFVAGYFTGNALEAMSIVAGLTILFFIGVKDDLIALSPRTKILAQLITALLLYSNNVFSTLSFNGFLGIDKLPLIIVIPLGCFIILSMVNSFNLIDGINGSASMVGIVIFSAFSYIFLSTGVVFYGLVAIAGVGFLVAFLRYNLSSSQKIFMGDTGSLIVGFVISVFLLRFLAFDSSQLQNIGILPENKLALAMVIPFIPFVDTLRVFTIRIFKNGNPFVADRNHVHHIMIDYMHLPHSIASLLLASINFIAIVIVYYLSQIMYSNQLFLILSLLVLVFILVLFYYNRSYITRKTKQKIRKAIKKSKESILFFFSL